MAVRCSAVQCTQTKHLLFTLVTNARWQVLLQVRLQLTTVNRNHLPGDANRIAVLPRALLFLTCLRRICDAFPTLRYDYSCYTEQKHVRRWSSAGGKCRPSLVLPPGSSASPLYILHLSHHRSSVPSVLLIWVRLTRAGTVCVRARVTIWYALITSA